MKAYFPVAHAMLPQAKSYST